MISTSDSEFARAFERGEIPPSEFHHAAHLRLALAYLAECGSVEEATAKMSAAIRQFAAALGKADKYHHTITVFWIQMLARLLDKNLPLTYYSPEVLWSDEARRGWIAPDLRGIETPDRATGPVRRESA